MIKPILALYVVSLALGNILHRKVAYDVPIVVRPPIHGDGPKQRAVLVFFGTVEDYKKSSAGSSYLEGGEAK